ncbi:MAG: anti-sigma factor, partial [Burkholderiaceae bacterium]
PQDKTLQLWTQPAGAEAPIPIALIEPGTPIELSAEQLPGLGAAQLFAISLEPTGGSPTGLPTGPILFAGNTEPI